MAITAKFANPEQTVILVSDGSVEINVPKDLKNMDYASLVANAIPIAAYQPPPVTVFDIRAERDRRLFALVGATSKAQYEQIVMNGTREAVRLLRKGEANWTDEESARSFELETFEAQIAAIEAKCVELEASLPANFEDDDVWSFPSN